MIEIVIVLTIIALLAALAIPAYDRVLEKARVARAIGDVTAIGHNALAYELEHGTYPASLSDLNMGEQVDPWGEPYVYVLLKGTGGAGARKDRFLVPINTYFDVYSKGPDGSSSPALTAKASKDDILWANDGGFVGIAEWY